MALKKRSKVDVSPSDKELPLNNLTLYEQNNHQLYKTLEQYRKDNEALNRNNVILSRKNDLLEHLMESVSSLWDSLNSDIDIYISRQVSEGELSDSGEKHGKTDSNGTPASDFWEKMISTNFPSISPGDPDGDVDFKELDYIFDSDEFLILSDHYDEFEWSEARDSFLNTKIHLFESKKNALLRSLKNCTHKSCSTDAGFINILKYNCLNYCKLFFILHNRYKALKTKCNTNRIELSRLSKQVAFLKFELRTFTGHDGKKESELSSSSDSDNDTVKVVENVEEVTEEMILGSSLYSRLFNYARNMDKEISRLESDNSDLRNKISSLTEGPSNQVMKMKHDFEKFVSEISQKVSSFESQYNKDSKELAFLRENYSIVSEELDQYKNEREKMVSELKSLETKMTKLLHQNASICKSICSTTEKSSTTNALNSTCDKNLDSKSSGDKNLDSKSSCDKNLDPKSSCDKNLDSKSSCDKNLDPKSSCDKNLDSKSSCDKNLDPKSSCDKNLDSKSSCDKNLDPKSSCDKNLDSKSSAENELDFYKEHLLNISEELEDVSSAFEKKQRMCDDLMRQINEASDTRKILERLQDSHANLVNRYNQLVENTNAKVALNSKKLEILETLLQDYKRSWSSAFNRGVYLQHQRDVAVSAVCELQSQYRKSCRSQKALQDYLASVRTGVTRSSSLESTMGEVENVIEQENTILRRRMTCTVCSENFRDHVITKCGHVFCHDCLANSIKTRNRKCPQCKITFDKNDTQRLFLD